MIKIINFCTDSEDIYIMKDKDGFTHLYLYELIELLAEPHACKYNIAYVSSSDCDIGEEVEGLEDVSSEEDIFWNFIDVINPNQICEVDKKFDYFWNKFYVGE